MSGPKDYTPPPRYSIQVFDGKLNRVFLLQSRLQRLCTELENFKISDQSLSIHFDCKTPLDMIRIRSNKVLKPMVFDLKETFSQNTYDRIDEEIDQRVSELQKLINECESANIDFQNKKKDYESYLTFLSFVDCSKISFEEFKYQVINYLKSNLEEKLSDLYQEASNGIQNIQFTYDKTPFLFGFHNRLSAEKGSVINYVQSKEEEINTMRSNVSDKVLTLYQTVTVRNRINLKISEESKVIIEKINTLITNSEDVSMRSQYKNELKKLMESESLKDVYFFKELHDSILESEKNRKSKQQMAGILSALNTISFHKDLHEERLALVQYILKAIDQTRIQKTELDNMNARYTALLEESNLLKEEEEIKRKEQFFLKSQLILFLENKGYEVMDDLEVIDFEKETDFLMKIKGQENYLNLKFKEDGSIRYVFQIPEEKNKLSTDQINIKLHEMSITCNDFQAVLCDLQKMGLKMTMRSEKPIEASSIVSVTKTQQEKIKKDSKNKVKHQQLRKKYLN